MPLIRNGTEMENIWSYVPDDHEMSPGGCITVSLGRFLNEASLLEDRNAAIGVRLQPEDDPALLADHMSALGLIEVCFPRYTDGRGYSQAQLLRRRLGYEGELRATGDVLRDQLFFMLRSGFDAFDLPETLDGEALTAAQAEFSHVYQKAAGPMRPVFDLRHRKDA